MTELATGIVMCVILLVILGMLCLASKDAEPWEDDDE